MALRQKKFLSPANRGAQKGGWVCVCVWGGGGGVFSPVFFTCHKGNKITKDSHGGQHDTRRAIKIKQK